MIERLLERLAAFATTRPRTVLLGCGLLALFGVRAFTVPIDLSFSGLMDRRQPEVTRYFEASSRFGLGGLLLVLVEGPEDLLDEAVLGVRRAVGALDVVRRVQIDPPREWLLAHAPWLVEPEVFDQWLALAGSDEDLDASRVLIRRLEVAFSELAPAPPANSRLVTIVMARDTFELALDADDFPVIRSVVERTLAPFDARARFAGMPAIITQEQEATLARMKILGPLSLLLVLAVLGSVERRPLVLLSIAVPMLFSVGCTLGLVGTFAGRLTLMESIFGVIVFGLGVDFAIHLLLRLREERALGRDFPTSLHQAILGTGRGVVAGAVTTIGAFLILAFAPDPVFYRLGLSGGLGLLLCLGFLLLMLPAAWSLIEPRSPVPTATLSKNGERGLGRVAAACIRRPRGVLLVGAVLVAFGAVQMLSLRYETDLERVFSRDIDAVDAARVLHSDFGVDPGPWLVAAEDLDAARRITADFDAEPLFARTQSLATFLRADAASRRDRLERLAPSLTQRVRAREEAALRQEAPASVATREALAPLSSLLAARSLGPPRRGSLPEGLEDRLVGPGGELLVYAFPSDPALDSAIAAQERQVAQAIDPRATSMSVIYETLIGTNRPWMTPILIAVAAFIVLVIQLDLRRVRLTLLALIPATAALPVTLGLLAAFGFSFNTVTLVAVPVLVGLSVDDGIHVVHRMLEQSGARMGGAVASVARSIALTTATTCASVGLLLFSRHPGIESVAILLLVGLPLSLAATVTLLPAAAALVAPRTFAGHRRSP